MSRKTVEKSLAACDSRRLHEENHLRFSNSKHFRSYWTKKHFISEWYFTKNHEIGSLVVRKVKTSWDSRPNRELWPASLGSRRAIADLFVMFIAWTSQKASKVHNPLYVQNQHIAIAEWEQSTTVVVLISGAFVWSRLIYERCLHLSDKFAYRSAHNNLFLKLRVIHKLKTALYSNFDPLHT